MALRDVASVDSGLKLRRPLASDLDLLALWFEGFFEDTGLGLPVGVTTEAAAQAATQVPCVIAVSMAIQK